MHSHRTRGRTLLLLGTIALAALGSLTACSGTTASTSSSSSGASGGTLTIAAATPPDTLDPAKAGGLPQYVDLAYSSLLTIKSPGTYAPLLAKSFQFVGTGNKEFEIKLRPGLKFSDGTALDSAAVVSYFNYFLNAGAAMSTPSKQLISKIETPDSTTVDFYFTSAYPDAPLAFTEGQTWGSPLSPKAIKDEKSNLGFETFGAGPYMLDRSQTTSGSLYTYVKNPDYFDKSAQKWDKVVVKVIANANSALQAVSTAQNGFTIGTWQTDTAAKAAGLTVAKGAPQRYILMLSDRNGVVTPALGQEKVRQAINYALDRSAIATALHGTADEQIVDPGSQGYYTDALYTHDLTKAKQLLSEAGYPKGFTFSAVVQGYDSNDVTAAQAIAADLKQAGITMNLVTATTFQDFISKQGTKKYSTDVESWGAQTMYASAEHLVLPTGNLNGWKTSDAQLNSLFATAAAQPLNAATASWEAFGKAVVQKAWFAPVASVPQSFYTTKGITVPSTGTYTPAPNPTLF